MWCRGTGWAKADARGGCHQEDVLGDNVKGERSGKQGVPLSSGEQAEGGFSLKK